MTITFIVFFHHVHSGHLDILVLVIKNKKIPVIISGNYYDQLYYPYSYNKGVICCMRCNVIYIISYHTMARLNRTQR